MKDVVLTSQINRPTTRNVKDVTTVVGHSSLRGHGEGRREDGSRTLRGGEGREFYPRNLMTMGSTKDIVKGVMLIYAINLTTTTCATVVGPVDVIIQNWLIFRPNLSIHALDFGFKRYDQLLQSIHIFFQGFKIP